MIIKIPLYYRFVFYSLNICYNKNMKIHQKILFLLFVLHAGFWLFVGTAYFILNNSWYITLLMFVNAALFIVFAWNVKKQSRDIFYVSVFYSSLYVILSITDKFGWMEATTLCFSLLLLVFLFLNRKYYITAKKDESKN